ncbi:xanthine dehydrogenase small subunit [Granulosicoccaceae sp. 1_MG-2023]|nr:xanthine dehydrogenase small subunit [Granulosicoccaceae sp. 1_MG-2023]
MPTTTDISFLLNDEPQQVSQLAPTLTLLRYLREHLDLTGTKEGCAEGDCGACTVVVGEKDGDRLALKTLNACIAYLPTLHGKAVYTVEYLRRNGGAHPVQQAMVDCHASQCGFCTPGFVMSLWHHYETRIDQGGTDRAELANALAGNLCRCTGYRPILDAGEQMFKLPPVRFDFAPARKRLDSLPGGSLHYEAGAGRFYAPDSLDELLQLRRQMPDSTLLAGGTDIGLRTTKQFRDTGPLIYTLNVPELHELTVDDDVLRIGAAVSLTDAYKAVCKDYPQLAELRDRFASPPIRNAGTLGGNLANGSPIGDSAPWLIALGAQVVLSNADGDRTIALEDLYTGYMQQSRKDDEILRSVIIPRPVPGLQFHCWKVSKRYDSDISAVCGAFALQLEDGKINKARVAFGGMAATCARAGGCEAALNGKPWNKTTLAAAMTALDSDFSPLSDMRASAAYRQTLARNLLQRFYLLSGSDINPAGEQSLRAFTLPENTL